MTARTRAMLRSSGCTIIHSSRDSTTEPSPAAARAGCYRFPLSDGDRQQRPAETGLDRLEDGFVLPAT